MLAFPSLSLLSLTRPGPPPPPPPPPPNILIWCLNVDPSLTKPEGYVCELRDHRRGGRGGRAGGGRKGEGMIGMKMEMKAQVGDMRR